MISISRTIIPLFQKLQKVKKSHSFNFEAVKTLFKNFKKEKQKRRKSMLHCGKYAVQQYAF